MLIKSKPCKCVTNGPTMYEDLKKFLAKMPRTDRDKKFSVVGVDTQRYYYDFVKDVIRALNEVQRDICNIPENTFTYTIYYNGDTFGPRISIADSDIGRGADPYVLRFIRFAPNEGCEIMFDVKLAGTINGQVLLDGRYYILKFEYQSLIVDIILKFMECVLRVYSRQLDGVSVFEVLDVFNANRKALKKSLINNCFPLEKEL